MLSRFMPEIVKPAQQPVEEAVAPAPASEPVAAPEPSKLIRQDLIDAKVRLHRKLIDDLNLAVLERLSKEELRSQIADVVGDYVRSERLLLNAKELDLFISEVFDELTGLGPIEPLLKDGTISDILINGHEKVYVERFGKLEPAPVRFKDEPHLLRIVNKIVAAVGRRVDESQPMIDARLADGSRINVAVRPVAVDGPLVSIRKFSNKGFDLARLVSVDAMSPRMAELLAAAVRARLTILVSGGTGSGKTSLLNALSANIPHDERLITIEDAAELRLQQPHVGRLETRPPNIEGRGEIRQRELVKNALRMRPDRIIIGEVRGEEAFDMLQAMNTGHEGSMATIHANNARDALSRLSQMIGMTGLPMSEASIRAQIASAITIIVQLQRFSDGRRRVSGISELTGLERDVIQLQDIFKFVRAGVSTDGQVRGEFRATGLRPSFMEELAVRGHTFSSDFFDPGHIK
jgi:pilus assembly protein CpaF